jgi:hypothetical protein
VAKCAGLHPAGGVERLVVAAGANRGGVSVLNARRRPARRPGLNTGPHVAGKRVQAA